MKSTSKKHVLIIGAGGICHAALPAILSLPLEKITLMDGDNVSEEPLERQWIFTKDDIGQSKVNVLNSWITRRKSDLEVEPIARFFQGELDFIPDLIFDFTDRLASKQSILSFSKRFKIPLIHAASQRNHGSVALLTQDSTLYDHLILDSQVQELEISCNDGVTASVVGTIGLQAAHLGWIFFNSYSHGNCLQLFDGMSNKWEYFHFKNTKLQEQTKHALLTTPKEVETLLNSHDVQFLHLGEHPVFPSYEPAELKEKINTESIFIIVCANGFEASSAVQHLYSKFKNIYAYAGPANDLIAIFESNEHTKN